MEIELYNCPHCNTKGVVQTNDNLCPNCKRTIESSDKVIQEVSVAEDVNANFNTKNWYEESHAGTSPLKTFGIVIMCFGFILLVLSIVVFVDIFRNDKSYFGGSCIALSFVLAIAGWVISTVGLKISNIPTNIKKFIRKLIYRFVVAFFFFLGMMYIFSMMGP